MGFNLSLSSRVVQSKKKGRWNKMFASGQAFSRPQYYWMVVVCFRK